MDDLRGQDIIDSRDVIARIEELESDKEATEDDPELDLFDDDDQEELNALTALAVAGEACAADWQHGETLISDNHFEEYAQDMAADIGAISSDAAWPACHIDWTAAADALKHDYTPVFFDGDTYQIHI